MQVKPECAQIYGDTYHRISIRQLIIYRWVTAWFACFVPEALRVVERFDSYQQPIELSTQYATHPSYVELPDYTCLRVFSSQRPVEGSSPFLSVARFLPSPRGARPPAVLVSVLHRPLRGAREKGGYKGVSENGGNDRSVYEEEVCEASRG